MNALPGIAAVHVLLAGHPELAALPLAWRVDPDGTVSADPAFCTPGSREAVRALAEVLGAKTEEYEVVNNGETYQVIRMAYDAKLSGLPIRAIGYERVAE